MGGRVVAILVFESRLQVALRLLLRRGRCSCVHSGACCGAALMAGASDGIAAGAVSSGCCKACGG